MAEILGSSSSRRPESSSAHNWVILIEDRLKQDEQDHNSGPEPKKVMYKVRKLLRDLNPEHYTPEEFPFGLFNRSPPDDLTRGDKCKLAMARAVLGVLGLKREDWPELCKRVVPEPKAMQDHYDEQGRYALSQDEIRNVLTLDAVFLASFLGSRFCGSFARSFPSFREAIDPMIASMIIPLMKDIFKVENQVPSSLIRAVLLILVKDLAKHLGFNIDCEGCVDDILKDICKGAVDYLSYLLPGMDNEDHPDLSDDNCLDCMHLLSEREKFVPDPGPYLECENFIECMYRMMCPKPSRAGVKSSLEASMMKTKSILFGIFRLKCLAPGSDTDSVQRKSFFTPGPASDESSVSAPEVVDQPKSTWNWLCLEWLSPRPEAASAPLISSSTPGLASDKSSVSSPKDVDLPPKSIRVIMPNVTELQKAGIQFRGRYGYFHDIEFKQGTLYLPIVTLSEDNEAFWRNLVAYEEVLLHEREKSSQNYCMQELTHYFQLMDKLIDDSNDMMVLKSGRHPTICAHTLGTDQAVADIFNNRVAQKCWVIPNKKWNDLHHKVYHYSNKYRRKMYWEFKQTHCGKPWLTVSVLVAILLLIATLLQTWYTIFPRLSVPLIN